MSTTQVVVTYAQLQEAFYKNPAVYRSADQAANGDAKERAQLIAAWNEAVSEVQKGDQGDVMNPTSTPSSVYQWINLKTAPMHWRESFWTVPTSGFRRIPCAYPRTDS
jgi:hypothetical protein